MKSWSDLDLKDQFLEIRTILQKVPRVKEATESFQFQSGLKLFEYRQEHDLSYRELAEKLNDQMPVEMNEDMISMMEFGDLSISKIQYQKVMEALGLKQGYHSGKAI